jgi:hypothetical protein
MELHDNTTEKINKLLQMGKKFLEKYEENESADVVFICSSFATKFSEYKTDIAIKRFNSETFKDEIYDFDNVMSSWMNNLPYRIEVEENNNGIYTTLFSILQGVNSLIGDDHFAWDDDHSVDDETESDTHERYTEGLKSAPLP